MNRLLVLLVAGLLTAPATLALLPGDDPAGPMVDATILRDSFGVPHIWADDAYSLFWANGYAQAQDRLVQMDILRHVSKGTLASLTGGYGSLALDLEARRELYTEQERMETIDRIAAMRTADGDAIDGDEWLAAFEAFAAGVNAWILEVTTDPTKLPGEYAAFGAAPAEWLVTDTVAIAEYLLDVFGRGSGGGEDSRARLLLSLQEKLGDEAGAAAFEDFVPGTTHPTTYTTIGSADAAAWDHTQVMAFHDLSDLTALHPAQQAAINASANVHFDDTRDLQERLADAGIPLKFGSNAQVIDKQFAANGENLLYGGPQMSYFAPMIPYEVALHGAGFEASGMGIAGAPGVIIGRGPTHSWTVTSGSSDQVDMVVERLNPANPEQYELDGDWVDMDCRTETHVVKPGPVDFLVLAGGSPPGIDIVEQRVCRSVHGPILRYGDSDGDGTDDVAFASHRGYRGDEARSGILWLQIGQTRSVQDIQDLLETFKFSFNFNIAEDRIVDDPDTDFDERTGLRPGEADGDIGYLHVGVQPIRHPALDARMPTPGWDSSLNWDHTDDAQLLTGRDLPHVINPAQGYTVNWNNNPSPGFPTGDNMEKWGSMQRAEMMEERLLARLNEAMGRDTPGLTLADLRDVHFQASLTDPYGDEFYDAMKTAALASGHPDADAAFDAVVEWGTGDLDFFYGGYGVDNNGEPVDGGAHADTMPDGMALFELWRDALQERVYADELGAGARAMGWNPPEHSDPHAAEHGTEGNKHSVLFDAMNGATSHAWCDDITTVPVETCQDQADAAMEDALATGAAAWQDQPNRISKFYALGALPAWEIPMTNRPSFQAFYDWGLPEGERSFNAVPPGASGHMNTVGLLYYQGVNNGIEGPAAFKPAHTDDQLDSYVAFQDKPLMMALGEVTADQESCTTVTGPGIVHPCL